MRQKVFIGFLLLFAWGGLHGCKSAEDLLQEAVAADKEGNQERAFKAYLGAAKQGNVEAENQVGERYEKGRGVDRDLDAAMDWYKKAMDASSVDGMANLGAVRIAWNLSGHAPPTDEGRPWLDKAVQWLHTAAEKENARACGLSAYLYEVGDYPLPLGGMTATQLEEKAQSKGDLFALLRKAWKLQPGMGDSSQDAIYNNFFVGASIGEPDGLRELSTLYETGRAVEKDIVYAHRLLQMAVRGSLRAEGALRTLESKMTPAQLEDARRLGPTGDLLPPNQAATIGSPTYTGSGSLAESSSPPTAGAPPAAAAPAPPAAPVVPTIRVVIPAAGEIWTRGQSKQVPIVYEAYCFNDNIGIELIRGNGVPVRFLLRPSSSNGRNGCTNPSEHTTYRTTLFPPTLSDSPGTDYKLRLRTKDGTITGESDFFTIQ